jgi:hypothetical protein
VGALPAIGLVVIFRTGQGVAAIPDGATAFSHRDANYLFHPITVWTDPANDEQMTAAARAYAAAMRPFSTGAAYLNFTHEAARVRDAYGDAKYAPPGGAQGHLRPGQPVPAQPEHPAQPRGD